MKDEYVNLNSPEVKRVLQHIFWNKTGTKPRLSNIKFNNHSSRRMLSVNGKDILRYDRHLHYLKKTDHFYAVYEFLKAVESLGL
jgi:hypothetical protein